MQRRQKHPAPEPRLMSRGDLAAYLRRSDGWLRDHLPELERAGMPRPDPLLGLWDRRAVDVWLDRRAGLVDDPGDDDRRRQELREWASTA